MNHIDFCYSEYKNPEVFAKQYCNYLSELLEKVDCDAVGQFITELLTHWKHGRKMFFIGNGGSASTASHFVNDICLKTKKLKNPIKAISLNDNMSTITAIANDYGYEHIFVKQLEHIMVPGDLLVAISASGNSPNIINAVKFTKNLGNRVVGLSGFDGGYLKKESDISINIDANQGEYGPVEDLHLVMDHLVTGYFCRAIIDIEENSFPEDWDTDCEIVENTLS